MNESRQDVALHCANVEKSYPVQKELRVWRMLLGAEARGRMIHALRNISMSVPRGKIVGILGKNGAGKSTLLRVLGGVYSPTRGHVETHGQIAGLFELGGMGNPHLTGREYATRYLRVMGARSEVIPALLDDIQEFSELEEAFDHRVRTYSSGMGARLYFATATALQNEIYLIDELLSVGDEHFQARCWQRMRQRLLNGASGILVTHDWAAVLKLCEAAHVIEQGRFVFSGPSDQAVVSYLKIPVPEAAVARFSSCNPQNHIAHSGQDTNIHLLVDILEPAPVDFAISIEMLRIGIGWEIVLLADGIPVGEQPGRYALKVSIPKLPLMPGSYSLNVFLSRRKLTRQDPTVSFDMRSWTTGNGYRLHIEGEATRVSAKLPYIARKLGEVA
ncbi:MAG: ABC transporter ATP-binding protein [Nitrospirota bacterium]